MPAHGETGNRVLIAGGGIGGLAAALGLAQKGYWVLVLEKASALGEIGAGIQLGPNAFHAFDHLGVGEAARGMAVYIDALRLMDALTAEEITTVLDTARAFIEKHIIEPTLPHLHLAMQGGDTFSGAIGDHKSALQEHLQATGAGQPHYVLTNQSGPDHQKRFRVEVRIQDKTGGSRALAESEGTTKKQAQQDAARLAFQRLISESHPAGVSAVEVPE